MEFDIFDLIGTAGVALIVAAYFLLTVRRIESDDLGYALMNAIGAALIIFSLVFDFNFSAFLMEVFWLLISLAGVAMAMRARRNAAES